MCAFMSAHMCADEGYMLMLGAFLNHIASYFFEIGIPTATKGLLICLGWLANGPQGSSSLYFPKAGITGTCHSAQSLTWVWGFELMSSNCEASPVLTESSPLALF